MNQEIKTYKAQIALFLSDEINIPSDELSVSIRKTVAGLNGNPIIPRQFTLPSNVPIEISSSVFPILQLYSADGAFKCDIKKSRVDIFYNVPINEQAEDFTNLRGRIEEIANQLFAYLNDKDLKINRVGYIIDAFYADAEPAKTLGTKMLKQNIDNLNNFSINYSQEFKEENLTYNAQHTLAAGEYKNTEMPDSIDGCIIRVDVNSSLKQELIFNTELIQRIEDIANTYFSYSYLKGLIIREY